MELDGFREALIEAKSESRNAIHSFHRYFGKFIPAIPAAAVRTYSQPGELVVDTFAGSGTTLVEAREAQRNAVGLDLNPLATFVSTVKTTPIAYSVLGELHSEILARFEATRRDLHKPYELPYVVNLDHWYRPEVLSDLLALRASICEAENDQARNFFLACFSAFNRSVSNADPRHVFPGYSKRMRALDEAGRVIDVTQSFDRAVRKRIKALSTLIPDGGTVRAVSTSASEALLHASGAALAVINPPYISSIRYLETMKMEMGWLGYVESQKHYLAMDRNMLGTERFYKADLQDIEETGIPKVDEQVSRIFQLVPKMAKTLSEYFIHLQPALKATCASLRDGGHLVVKISDTSLRGEVVRTGFHIESICHAFGMRTVHNFSDDYATNSRSLLTARNTYSGLMTQDQILVLRKDA